MPKRSISVRFDYQVKEVVVRGSKLRYVEAGEGRPILFAHGCPDWSYVWRNVIPYAAKAGRAIAPDLIGMGRSEKPDISYTFASHVPYFDGFIENLGLSEIIFVAHDWGVSLAIDYAMRHEENVRGLVFMEQTVKPTLWREWTEPSRGFMHMCRTRAGRRLIVEENYFLSPQVLQSMVSRKLTPVEIDRYQEPYPSPDTRKVLWRWPTEYAIGGRPRYMARRMAQHWNWLQRSSVPKLLFYGEPGEGVRANDLAYLRRKVRNVETRSIGPGIHFLPEDNPDLMGEALVEWCCKVS